MAFTTPHFNLAVAIYRFGTTPPTPPDVVSTACLSLGRRSNTPAIWNFPQVTAANRYSNRVLRELLLPKLTDIRMMQDAVGGRTMCDAVEVPRSSGRFYYVLDVDDVGKGFTNEYRLAFIIPCDNITAVMAWGDSSFAGWPFPIP